MAAMTSHANHQYGIIRDEQYFNIFISVNSRGSASRTVIVNLERKLQIFYEHNDFRDGKLHKKLSKRNVKTNQAKFKRTNYN